jgi:hypothetical protein
MPLRLFGLRKKDKTPQPPADAPAPAADKPAPQEPVEFQEVGGAPTRPRKTVNARSGGGKPTAKKGASKTASTRSKAKKAPKKAPAKKTNQGKKTASKKR